MAKRWSYKDLVVWNKAMDITVLVYQITTSHFPDDERFGLTSQIRRASSSMPLNIGEWNERHSDKVFAQFLQTAKWSCTEVQIAIELAFRLKYIDQIIFDKIMSDTNEIQRMIWWLLWRLSQL